jgi:hypothetical protein
MSSFKDIKKFISRKTVDRDGDNFVGDGTDLERKKGTSAAEQYVKNLFKRRTQKKNSEKTFSLKGFIIKFAKETASLSFTLAGSVVVFTTLSGDTRKIAMIATGIALAAHYTNQMLKNDED